MSAEWRPSFRGFKDKIKQKIKSNTTTSIRERLVSNETYHHVRDKYHNLTDAAKNQPSISKLLNKTKSLLPSTFTSKGNDTTPKGFYDSLFADDTTDGVYFKTAIICLWAIALLCIVPTIIGMFIPTKGKPSKTLGVRMIFFHIFVCELCYLIYILLSMINVAQDFQLNAFMCDFANYGMYVTIPVMHFALFFLAMERTSKFCKNTMTWAKIFAKPYVVQLVLIAVWLISAAIIVALMMLKKQFSVRSIASRASEFAPPIFNELTKRMESSYRCSIDGRLSAVFKVLFVVLFVVLIVLVVKSMALSLFYKFCTLSCCTSSGKKRKPGDLHLTVLYVLFLFLNICFSFPFYSVSIAHSVFTRFTSTKDLVSTKLKICFLLRLTSIILQCMAFVVIESHSWTLLRRLLFCVTCRCVSALDDGATPRTNKPTANGTKGPVIIPVVSDTDDDEGADDVFIDGPANQLLPSRSAPRAANESSDDDDSSDDSPVPVTRSPKRSTHVKRPAEPEPKCTPTRIPSRPQTAPSAINRKPSKSRADPRPARPRPTKPPSSSDTNSIARADSDAEVKPLATRTSKPEHRRHRSKHSPSSRPTTSRTDRNRHSHHRSGKPKRDRIREMQEKSHEV